MANEIDLLEVRLGRVEAPAGCGKTDLIATSLRRCRPADKPVLVLTHTNAGANALQQRLVKNGVSPAVYRISTIDGWAMRMVAAFPGGSGYQLQTGLTLDYPAIRRGAAHLLAKGNIDPLIAATYSRLLVDEYQDCSTVQHDLVLGIRNTLPTVVLGDPLQAIFGFNGNVLVNWTNVESAFPDVGQLHKPWRWIKAGAQPLGEWLVEIRKNLKAGTAVDLRKGHPGVSWVQVKGEKDVQGRMAAAAYKHPDGDGSLLIIAEGSDKEGQRNFAKRTPGASTVEAVDLKDLTGFAMSYKPGSAGCLDQLLEFGAAVMTKVDPEGMRTRLKALGGSRAKKEATVAEQAAQTYVAKPSLDSAGKLLRALGTNPGARVYRPAIYYGALDALSSVAESGKSFAEAAISVREAQRHKVRVLPKRAVGSTLLLKGLEADVAVVMHPEKMKATHLYVALTRGARKVLVCSPTPELNPFKTKKP